MKPVSKPPGAGEHGLSKSDWVAVWFLARKMKRTVSPGTAAMVSGSNFKPLGPPTTTSKMALLAAGAKEATSKAARTILDVENML
jgi:hypothetical protein